MAALIAGLGEPTDAFSMCMSFCLGRGPAVAICCVTMSTACQGREPWPVALADDTGPVAPRPTTPPSPSAMGPRGKVIFIQERLVAKHVTHADVLAALGAAGYEVRASEVADGDHKKLFVVHLAPTKLPPPYGVVVGLSVSGNVYVYDVAGFDYEP